MNAVSQRREFHGALIKVDGGVGCLHPWPEFGDAPIEDQLKLLRDGRKTNVIERALRMAAVDGVARRKGVSLFDGLEIPLSHYSWDLNQPAAEQARRVLDEEWPAIKTKGSRKWEDTIGWMVERSADFGAPRAGKLGTKVDAPLLRIDFNSCLTEAQFADFMRALPSQVRGRLDFIEDPFPYDTELWTRAQHEFEVRLACDKGLKRIEDLGSSDRGYGVAVLKPGRRDWRAVIPLLPTPVRVVMTSAMDHAIGQSFAAYEAALALKELDSRMDLCGLCTEHLFEEDEFFTRIRSHGGILEVDRSGTGLGFDEVIAKLPWRQL